jgi:hypothetical protein
MILSSADSLGQFRSLSANVKDLHERLNQTQSDVDRQVSALYHDIEMRDLDEAVGYSAVLLLQDALRKRVSTNCLRLTSTRLKRDTVSTRRSPPSLSLDSP